MFPLGLLTGLIGLGAYMFGKKQGEKSNSNNNNATVKTDATDATASSKAQNVYNYYTNDSANGTTLFNGQTQKKRTLFGN